MTKSIKLYDNTNYADLLELLITSIDPDGKKAKITEKLRADFRESNENQRFKILQRMTLELIKSGGYCADVDYLAYELGKSGLKYWSDFQGVTVFVSSLDTLFNEFSFLTVDIDVLTSDPISGLGVHPIGDLIVAGHVVETGDTKFLKPYYPEFKVADPFVECFSPSSIEEAFTELLELNLKDTAGGFYERLAQKGMSIKKHMEDMYSANELLIHRSELLKSFNKTFPNDSQNERTAYSFDFVKLNKMLDDGGKKAVTLKDLYRNLRRALL